MAKNFQYSGKRITLTNLSAAVAAGTICRRGGFIGIPINHAATGMSVAFALEGAWAMTFSPYAGVGAGPQPAAGTILYWDTANGALTNGCGANDFAAVKCITAVSASNGSFVGLLLPQGRPKTADQA